MPIFIMSRKGPSRQPITVKEYTQFVAYYYFMLFLVFTSPLKAFFLDSGLLRAILAPIILVIALSVIARLLYIMQ